MFRKDIINYADAMQKIEDKDPNYRENEKWQYYRKQQDLMYMAQAKQELIELKNKVDHYNKRIKQLEEFLEKNKGLLENGTKLTSKDVFNSSLRTFDINFSVICFVTKFTPLYFATAEIVSEDKLYGGCGQYDSAFREYALS